MKTNKFDFSIYRWCFLFRRKEEQKYDEYRVCIFSNFKELNLWKFMVLKFVQKFISFHFYVHNVEFFSIFPNLRNWFETSSRNAIRHQTRSIFFTKNKKKFNNKFVNTKKTEIIMSKKKLKIFCDYKCDAIIHLIFHTNSMNILVSVQCDASKPKKQ